MRPNQTRERKMRLDRMIRSLQVREPTGERLHMGVHVRVAVLELSELDISSNPGRKIINILRTEFLETRGLRRALQEEL